MPADAATLPPGLSGPQQGRVPSRRRRLRVIAVLALAVAVSAAALVALTRAPANADPSANDWYRLRMCESSNNYSINTGNGYYGAYQFDLSTWRSVGGTGYPNQASPAEQDYRALYLYRMRGWQPWTCARILGLKPDSMAGSGIIPPLPPSLKSGSTVPAWPGTYYARGQTNSNIAVWQKKMKSRGASPIRTDGYFDSTTATVVHQVQVQNGIAQGGHIGPLTWAAAWTGKYTNTTPKPAPAKTTPKPAPAKTTPTPAPAKTTPKPTSARRTAAPARSGATAAPSTAAGTTGVPATPSSAAPTTSSASSAVAIPAYPGSIYRIGAHNANIAVWQKQLKERGATSIRTDGYFDARTEAFVLLLQTQNGIDRGGDIGVTTWVAAWTGKFSNPLAGAPAWPGALYSYGQTSPSIAAWQKQMNARGAHLRTDGYFDEATVTMALDLQAANDIPRGGQIGPLTWAAAWTGKLPT